ncbi:rRNA small subunit 7-methylguanosine (m7G) methyltransferase GidB [Corynebacterium camporealensis]|uniref:16S rRNA (guanine(527)-N(7))-methyltransferase RsmG n=1 Tax=Corynebacterium camporealensis TaxID=161896 RepID=UPI000D21125B|nr:RsmG family class I SAM-dependent methyltransferase [Corynebacterium camporealensis]AVH89300.1 rRNA small subunit 7-methylguanosine (m7G) methyltransferase GidB [Corynebacterium camporealensis]
MSTRGFIGPREVPRLWERHILNCAVVNEVIPDAPASSTLDLVPACQVSRWRLLARISKSPLVEPLLKRSNYLKEIVDKLGLDNVTVIRGRAEEGPVKKEVGGADVVTSRAVAPLGKLAKWSLPLVRKGGEMIALKGSSVHEELERDVADIKRAGGGKAEVSTISGTTIIRVPRVN